jgi:hypothetical protein
MNTIPEQTSFQQGGVGKRERKAAVQKARGCQSLLISD